MATTTHDTSRTVHLLTLMKDGRAAHAAAIFRIFPHVHVDNDPSATFWDAALHAQQISLA